jgi:predicted metal-dependent phosphoesterase TrpH
MKTVLTNYDIYPKVFPVRKESAFTIRPLGAHAVFKGEGLYKVTVIPMNETNRNLPPGSEHEKPYPVYKLKNQTGSLHLNHLFADEGQYFISVESPEGTERDHRALPAELRVYAVEEDVFRLRPYTGDMHVHSFRSDGKEGPEIVAANYRKAGFDFLALTDHERYEPSLEMIDAYRDASIDIKLFPGEEVHPIVGLPKNYTHYIHFGGNGSVNSLIREDPEKYHEEVRRLAAELDIPPGINREEYASCYWVCREIHKAGGLAIMVHPHWIDNRSYHVREDMARLMLKSKLFDAFELIGGQTMEENQMQVSLWQDVRAEGCFIPALGCSDSHGTVNAAWFQIAKTVVLAESCEKDAILDAIRKGRTAALEQYHGERIPRIYGLHRYVSFVNFLLAEYFPLHDELCFEEGRLMKDYVCGTSGSAELLGKLSGRCAALMKKCWGS